MRGLEVEAVALVQAVGDVGGGTRAQVPEEEGQQGRGAHPVHVIVAVEGDALLVDHGADEPLHGGGHALHAEGVRQVRQAVGQEGGGGLRSPEAPVDEDPGGERMDPELRGQRLGLLLRYLRQ